MENAVMKIIKLTQESRNNILEELLKRSPNHYDEYEKIVSDIIKNFPSLFRYNF